MATVAPLHQAPSHSSRESPANASHSEGTLPPAPPPPPATAPANKNKKGKKGATNDATDAARQLQAKIAQLELDQAGRTEEDAEIEREVKKANRELQSQIGSMEGIGKIDMIQRKYSELLSEMKRTEREHIKAKKRGDQLQKEKDSQRSELTKATSMKEKLEKLSRELTKENKKLKEDLRDIKERTIDRGEELHRRLEDMVDEVEDVIAERRPAERSYDDVPLDRMFREKFKSLVEQYEMREIHFHSILRTRELEIQYHIAQHEKLRKAQDAELSKSHQLTRQFKQVEDTLNNSNDLFLTFRKEMEEMSKKTKRLEKENMQLVRKQEATNKSIFQMAEERSHNQKELNRLAGENEKLKKLCRAMQTNGYGGRADMVAAGVVDGAEGAVEGGEEEAEDDDDATMDRTDSEYDEYEDDDDDGSLEGEYDDDTEEEVLPPPQQPSRVYGPVPPPPPPPAQDLPNGSTRKAARPANGAPVGGAAGVNGVRH